MLLYPSVNMIIHTEQNFRKGKGFFSFRFMTWVS